MSISRRTAIAVRTIGVASAAAALALGVAGNAFACHISEFSASATCTADHHGAISVVDKDTSRTEVTITVTQGGETVGTKDHVRGSDGPGVTVDFPVAWKPNTDYKVTVVAGEKAIGDLAVKTPADACELPPAPPATTPAAPTTPATTTPAAPTTPATTAPSATTTSSAAVVDDTNAPSPAGGGSTDLAETGGGSNTGMIAGVAGALVVIGGGAVFGLRRRGAGAHH